MDDRKIQIVEEDVADEVADEEVARAEELDLDDEDDVEGAIREAVAAVEQVEDRKRTPAEAAAVEEVERLQKELADMRDRSVRTLAELDNFRKRAERERQDIRRYALVEPMRDFLDVVDNLERAMAASGSFEDLKTGVEMILHQMRDLLRQHNVQTVEAEGHPFDPNVHEAVAREEDAEIEAPQVIQELQRGYTLHDRLLRPARVKVAVPIETSGKAKGSADGNEGADGNED